ncbi:unnamed protein product, partial [Prunus brigantina]
MSIVELWEDNKKTSLEAELKNKEALNLKSSFGQGNKKN